MKLDVAILSKPGGRKYNEDYTGAAELGAFGCFVLADGLGGHRGGDIASKLTVESIMKSFKESPGASTDKLKSFVCEADILLRNSGPDQLMGGLPKTTLVVLLTGKNHACWAHIGDSRLYLFRDGNLLLQTKDHSVPQYLADSGSIKASDIRFHEDRNRLTAAFDGENLNRVSFSDDNFPLEASDCFLLCSDGFWEYVLEAEMEEDLKSAKTPALWLDLMEKRLSARVESGNDNYSALAFFNS
jgi:PPM family protein phosphatase